MLEGLEIAEIHLSQLEFSGRLDSEYYRPSLLRAEELIRNKGGEALESLCDFVIGPFGSAFTVENYTDESTYRYIRGKDVKPMALADDDNVYMPKVDFDRLSKYALRAGDVLVSVVGTLGNSALIEPQHLPAIFSCKSTALRTRGIDPRYLISYLNCDLGRGLLMRKERGAVQKGLNLDDLKSLQIYVAGQPFQQRITEIHKNSFLAREQAKRLFGDAETALLQTLGLDDWNASEPLTYIRSSRDAFAAGRLDAEYQQPKYEALRAELSGRFALATALALGQVTKGVTVQYSETGGIPIIRSGDLGDIDNDEAFMRADSTEPIFFLEKGDVLISSIGFGSIGKVQVFDKEGRYGTVSEVTVIRQRQINPYYLAAFLRSKAGQMQIERHITGATGQLHLYPRDVATFWIPLLSADDQAEFERYAKQARAAKQRAAQLLDAAKRAVEIAIEDSEAAALAYLEEAVGGADEGGPT